MRVTIEYMTEFSDEVFETTIRLVVIDNFSDFISEFKRMGFHPLRYKFSN